MPSALPPRVCCLQGTVQTGVAGEAAAGEKGAGPASSPGGGGQGETPRSAPAAGGLISCVCCVQSPATWQIKRTIWQKQMNEGVKTCSWCDSSSRATRCNACGLCKGQQERRGVTARCTSCGHLQMARCCRFWVRCDFSLGLGFFNNLKSALSLRQDL